MLYNLSNDLVDIALFNLFFFVEVFIVIVVLVIVIRYCVTIRFTTLYQKFISQGNNYTNTHSNLGFYGELFASWRNWSFMFEFVIASNNLWGETLRIGERNHQFSLRYNRPKWSAAVCVYNSFEKEYSQKVENFVAIAPHTNHARMEAPGNDAGNFLWSYDTIASGRFKDSMKKLPMGLYHKISEQILDFESYYIKNYKKFMICLNQQ